MTVDTAAKTIGLILAPVVMLTACGILVSAMLQHYGSINDRVRAMNRERLELLAGKDPDTGSESPVLAAERLKEIDYQLPMLLHRHELVRNAVLTIYSSVLVFVASMFCIAAAALASSDGLATASLIVFLAGTAVMLVGLVFFALDIHGSHASLRYEAQRVSGLRLAHGVEPNGTR
jgi:hypothetical protein